MDFDSLTFQEVTRNFGRSRALNRVSLPCRSAEITALHGSNGAGKSTLLSIAATLLSPSSGTIRYGAQTAREGGAALRGRIGFLAHDLFLYPELSAAENLSFFARLHRVSDPANAVDAALRQSNLHERRDDPVMTFSRGMRQRLANERALLHAPRLVLLDEPFTGLDDAAVAATRTRLSVLRDAGCIVLLTTHDLEAVEPIVDRAVVLAGGRLNAIEKGDGGLRAGYRKLVTS